jgi:hypothetical protein
MYNQETIPTQENPVNINISTLDETKTINQNQTPMNKKTRRAFIIFCSVAVIGGILTGYGSFRLQNKEANPTQVQNLTVNADQVKNGDVFGVQDKDAFADNATGYVEKGGVNGEGSHSLLREGGVSQTVALTSSIADLDKLVGMEIKVYGETYKAEKAGWFMDVGRIEVINTQAQAPLQTLD